VGEKRDTRKREERERKEGRTREKEGWRRREKEEGGRSIGPGHLSADQLDNGLGVREGEGGRRRKEGDNTFSKSTKNDELVLKELIHCSSLFEIS
jgi:hypothetical protein